MEYFHPVECTGVTPSHHCYTSLSESVSEILRTDAAEIIGESDREDWPFRVFLKNSCNEKLSKVGVIEVDEIKRRAGKQGTHLKRFHENIKFLRALNTPASISVIIFPYVF